MRNKLILCSIDMCKSTKVKYRIESKPVEYREKLYQKLVNRMVKQEMTFFAQLNRSFKNNYNIDHVNLFDKIFVIKNIGDEFWFSLPTDENKQNSASNIIYSLFEAFNAIREDEIIIDKKELSIEEEMDWKADRNFLRLPVNHKIYVDIVDSYIDYTERRTTTFFENYDNIFFPDDKLPKENKEKMLAGIFNNWNMGTCLNSNIKSKKIKYANRTDLFGYQIDHFFRFTKEAKHKLFAIGDRAFKELNISTGEHGKKDPHIGIKCGRPGAGGIKYVMRFKKESEAKDVNSPYFIHYFITDYDLHNIKHRYNELGDDSYNEAYELMCDLGAYNYI